MHMQDLWDTKMVAGERTYLCTEGMTQLPSNSHGCISSGYASNYITLLDSSPRTCFLSFRVDIIMCDDQRTNEQWWKKHTPKTLYSDSNF